MLSRQLSWLPCSTSWWRCGQLLHCHLKAALSLSCVRCGAPCTTSWACELKDSGWPVLFAICHLIGQHSDLPGLQPVHRGKPCMSEGIWRMSCYRSAHDKRFCIKSLHPVAYKKKLAEGGTSFCSCSVCHSMRALGYGLQEVSVCT